MKWSTHYTLVVAVGVVVGSGIFLVRGWHEQNHINLRNDAHEIMKRGKYLLMRFQCTPARDREAHRNGDACFACGINAEGEKSALAWVCADGAGDDECRPLTVHEDFTRWGVDWTFCSREIGP